MCESQSRSAEPDQLLWCWPELEGRLSDLRRLSLFLGCGEEEMERATALFARLRASVQQSVCFDVFVVCLLLQRMLGSDFRVPVREALRVAASSLSEPDFLRVQLKVLEFVGFDLLAAETPRSSPQPARRPESPAPE